MPPKSMHSAPASATIPSQPCAGNERRRRRRKNPAMRTSSVAAVMARPIARWSGNRNRCWSIRLSAYGSAVGRSFRRAPGRFLLCSACFFRRNNVSETPKLERGLGLIEATSLNMTFMVGIGPFVVIPLVIQQMGGPGSLLAWSAGALLAVFDGCIWAELGAAMPQAGGSYVYLREAYGPQRWGRLMSFLFIWQTLFQGPLSISSGALGFADYSLYLTAKIAVAARWLNAHPRQMVFVLANYNRLVAIILIAIAIVLLYRRITAIGKISTVLWMIAAATIAWLIYGGATHFHKDLVFTYPAGAWSFSWIFFAGLGHASVQAIYSYLGYYNVCNLGGEMKNPERNVPRAIFLSIFGIAALYFAMQTCILAVVPWQEARNSPFVASLFFERT